MAGKRSDSILGDKLRVIRLAAGMNQSDLATRAGCSIRTVWQAEAGRGRSDHYLRFTAILGSELTGRCLPPADHLGARIRLLRSRYGMSQRDLAAASVTSPSTIASMEAGNLGAHLHLTADDDGLTHEWHGTVYMNPPYGRDIPRWTAKARVETILGRASPVIGLVPARTDTRWWHGDIAGVADAWLIKGRLSFGDGLQPAPFPSALALWAGTPNRVTAISRAFPTAWHVARNQSIPLSNESE